MKKTLFLAAFILSSVMVFATNPITPVKTSIDLEKSSIEWVGKKSIRKSAQWYNQSLKVVN